MKYTITFITALSFFSILDIIPAHAQQINTIKLDRSTSLLLKEFNTILQEEEQTVRVYILLGNRNKNEDDKQLQSGDIILMMNGKRAENISTLREIYESVDIGEQIQLGIQRGEERFILRKDKKETELSSSGNSGIKTMTFNSKNGSNSVMLPELGLIIRDEGDQVIVASLLERFMPNELKGLNLENHSLIKVNGESPETAEKVRLLINSVETGADLKLVFMRNGEEKKVTLKKPKGVIRIGNNN